MYLRIICKISKWHLKEFALYIYVLGVEGYGYNSNDLVDFSALPWFSVPFQIESHAVPLDDGCETEEIGLTSCPNCKYLSSPSAVGRWFCYIHFGFIKAPSTHSVCTSGLPHQRGEILTVHLARMGCLFPILPLATFPRGLSDSSCRHLCMALNQTRYFSEWLLMLCVWGDSDRC